MASCVHPMAEGIKKSHVEAGVFVSVTADPEVVHRVAETLQQILEMLSDRLNIESVDVTEWIVKRDKSSGEVVVPTSCVRSKAVDVTMASKVTKDIIKTYGY